MTPKNPIIYDEEQAIHDLIIGQKYGI